MNASDQTLGCDCHGSFIIYQRAISFQCKVVNANTPFALFTCICQNLHRNTDLYIPQNLDNYTLQKAVKKLWQKMTISVKMI